MKKLVSVLSLVGCALLTRAQDLPQRLSSAVQQLLADPQMKHAILDLAVVKSETGEKIYDINAQTGLVPASCQKIITAATAFDILGAAYRYRTCIGYDGNLEKGVVKGNLYLSGSGDPSLGSWRYAVTNEQLVRKTWAGALTANGIKRIEGKLIGYNGRWDANILPGGWIWDDMGNYYGAGVAALNWHENQYDLTLRSGKETGTAVTIVSAVPRPYQVTLNSELTAAAKGTGDNAYIYLPPAGSRGYVRGTIPVEEKAFTISGSFPDPAMQTVQVLKSLLDSLRIPVRGVQVSNTSDTPAMRVLHCQLSPSLDSLNYWFLRKSINLYGEAFLRTIAYEKTGSGLPDKGLQLLREFWREKGIEPAALHMIDGSGLSPQNRVTTDALVKVLQYARTRDWFRYYYDALPTYNQMKLKSGTIGGAKSFAGYHTAKDGTAYTMAIIVNNYDGSAAEIVKKLFAVLDVLK
ncbi:D-alanyl-D-alanine carboxypeptidase/D-alanyl-D-alanine endopeptidase [Sediminibacterium soli]|uniref:D-alanyl-D-alanine carboxypeptidase/D-alanyl-D-alanine endopeptidase n=1 Tax=Sediminibacterium soli TaxID=2698829 RepID=UPI00137A7970|nr:D-alanyl-D-alanine carboxypeptidase/D-alanyl-D-alanine-endopeptidase [Sediminibacterium soli]NCI46178.1 D-alanyl-D-alanine carboxypeptidase/D-alanyl-D-alanine-endopeptidase [Sediminibacterium soli]